MVGTTPITLCTCSVVLVITLLVMPVIDDVLLLLLMLLLVLLMMLIVNIVIVHWYFGIVMIHFVIVIVPCCYALFFVNYIALFTHCYCYIVDVTIVTTWWVFPLLHLLLMPDTLCVTDWSLLCYCAVIPLLLLLCSTGIVLIPCDDCWYCYIDTDAIIPVRWLRCRAPRYVAVAILRCCVAHLICCCACVVVVVRYDCLVTLRTLIALLPRTIVPLLLRVTFCWFTLRCCLLIIVVVVDAALLLLPLPVHCLLLLLMIHCCRYLVVNCYCCYCALYRWYIVEYAVIHPPAFEYCYPLLLLLVIEYWSIGVMPVIYYWYIVIVTVLLHFVIHWWWWYCVTFTVIPYILLHYYWYIIIYCCDIVVNWWYYLCCDIILWLLMMMMILCIVVDIYYCDDDTVIVIVVHWWCYYCWYGITDDIDDDICWWWYLLPLFAYSDCYYCSDVLLTLILLPCYLVLLLFIIDELLLLLMMMMMGCWYIVIVTILLLPDITDAVMMMSDAFVMHRGIAGVCDCYCWCHWWCLDYAHPLFGCVVAARCLVCLVLHARLPHAITHGWLRRYRYRAGIACSTRWLLLLLIDAGDVLVFVGTCLHDYPRAVTMPLIVAVVLRLLPFVII